MDIILIIWIFCVLWFLVWDKFWDKKEIFENPEIEKLKVENNIFREENIKLKIENEKINENSWKIKWELDQEKSEKSELQWKNKQMFVNLTSFQEKLRNFEEKNWELNKKVAKFESERTKKEKDFEQKIWELDNSRKSLEDEKIRIRKEDEEKIQVEQDNKNRIWADHEIEAIAKMKEVCIKPEISFQFFENTNLPENFDWKLKPDFLIEFLWQYIIFDAKMSRSANLQTYINEQVKSTVKKIKVAKNSEEIYSTVFFVVPHIAIDELKKLSFYEDWFNFFIITAETFESVISSFKKITSYENLDKIDPKERENIVNLLASYDQHISQRNAVDILSSISWVKVSQAKEILDSDMLEEIELKKKKMRIENFKPTDLKRLISNPEEQIEEMKKLVVAKKSKISKGDLEDWIEQISLV